MLLSSLILTNCKVVRGGKIMALKVNFKKSGTAIAAIAIILISAACLFFVKKESALLRNTNVLRRVTFRTNGKITPQWIAEELSLGKGVNLFDLNIGEIEKKLRRIQQIKNVLIEKRYPDELFIAIVERLPLLKFAANVGGKVEYFLIDGDDGQIFSPTCYKKNEINGVVSASLRIRRARGGQFRFLPLNGINRIKKFIVFAKSDFPDIFREIRAIDLKNYDSRDGAEWSTIELALRSGIVVVIGPKNFDTQMLKLDYILHTKCVDELPMIKKINVSIPSDAIIERK
jgi:hypothetical protein